MEMNDKGHNNDAYLMRGRPAGTAIANGEYAEFEPRCMRSCTKEKAVESSCFLSSAPFVCPFRRNAQEPRIGQAEVLMWLPRGLDSSSSSFVVVVPQNTHTNAALDAFVPDYSCGRLWLPLLAYCPFPIAIDGMQCHFPRIYRTNEFPSATSARKT